MPSYRTHAARAGGAALLLAGLFLAGGCKTQGWRFGQGNVAAVEKGWNATKVRVRIGEPDHIEYGRGAYTGWEEWEYPTGSVFLYRLTVREIALRAPDEPPPPRREEKWPRLSPPGVSPE